MVDKAKVRRDAAEWNELIEHQTAIRQEVGQNWIHGTSEYDLLPEERQGLGAGDLMVDAVEDCPLADAE